MLDVSPSVVESTVRVEACGAGYHAQLDRSHAGPNRPLNWLEVMGRLLPHLHSPNNWATTALRFGTLCRWTATCIGLSSTHRSVALCVIIQVIPSDEVNARCALACVAWWAATLDSTMPLLASRVRLIDGVVLRME